MMRRTVSVSAAGCVLSSVLCAVPAVAQVTCAVFGNIVSCSAPTGSFDQVQLGQNSGVIIDDQTTTPYTILTPPPPAPIQTTPRTPESFLYSPPSRPSPFHSPLDSPLGPRDRSLLILGD